MRPKEFILLVASLAALAATGCQKQAEQNQQTPDSDPTTTSPMNPK